MELYKLVQFSRPSAKHSREELPIKRACNIFLHGVVSLLLTVKEDVVSLRRSLGMPVFPLEQHS